MVSPKPWKAEAIARLLLSGLVCICAASVLTVAGNFALAKHAVGLSLLAATLGACVCFGVALAQLTRPWELEDFFRRTAVMLGSLFAGLCLAMWLEKIAGTAPKSVTGVQTVLVEAAALFLFTRFVREHGLGWAEAFGLSNRQGFAALCGVAAACVYLPMALALQRLSGLLLLRLHWEPREQQAVEVIRSSASGANRVAFALIAVLFAPVVEETLFRGILYPAIKQAGFPRLALWSTALLFALAHFNTPTFVPLVTLALVLTALYEATNNLLACMAAHATFNFANLVLLYYLQHQGPR